MKPRLLYIENRAETFASHRLKQALIMDSLGYDVHAVVPEGPAVPQLQDCVIPVHRYPYERGIGSARAELRTMRALTRVLRRLRPDIAHVFTPKLALVAGSAVRLTRVPAAVFTVTGLGYGFSGSGLKRLAVRQALLSGLPWVFGHPNSLVLFQNRDDFATLAGQSVPYSRARLVLGSGVDTDAFPFLPLPIGRPVVMFASRLLRDKGVEEFAAAADALRDHPSNPRYVLVGATDSGNPASVTNEMVSGWVVDGRLEWWGHRDDMAEVLGQASIFCLPSYREGLPQVALEAMSTGRPILSTDAVGCREVVLDGANGVLVPPRDADALVMALKQMLQDSGALKAMGAASRQVALERFSLRRVVQDTHSAYQALLGQTTN